MAARFSITTQWAAFTEGLAALPVADDTDLAVEADIDYDDMPPLPIAPIPNNRTTAQAYGSPNLRSCPARTLMIILCTIRSPM